MQVGEVFQPHSINPSVDYAEYVNCRGVVYNRRVAFNLDIFQCQHPDVGKVVKEEGQVARVDSINCNVWGTIPIPGIQVLVYGNRVIPDGGSVNV